MSLSIEILPIIELKNNWKDEIIQKNTNMSISEISNNYFRIFFNQIAFFDTWKCNKSISSDFFNDEDYLKEVKGLDKIILKRFMNDFKKISYTIIIESKPTRQENELQYMVVFAKEIAEITEGIILFDQDFLGYKSNNIYLPENLV